MLTYLADATQAISVRQKNGLYELDLLNGTTRFATDAEVLAAAQAAKRAAIKEAARQTILARYPEWMQANLTARAVELVSLNELTGPEWQRMQSIWSWIKAVRAHSDLLEADVANCTTAEAVEGIVIGGWPD